MNLRETIRREVLDAGHEGFAYGFGDGTQSRVKVDEHTDAAIAAMRDALLSDTAVMAAAQTMYRADGNPGPWDTERPTYQDMYRGRAEDALTAALAALGVQEGED